MSTRPNFLTAASTIASQFASELGRFATLSTLPPSFSHSAATFFNSAALLAQSTTLAPAAASTFAAGAGSAGDDCGLAADVEQRERIFQDVFGHDLLAMTDVPHRSLPRTRGREQTELAVRSIPSCQIATTWMRSSPRMTQYAAQPSTITAAASTPRPAW